MIPLTKAEKAAYLAALRETQGRLLEAVKKSGVDAVALAAACCVEDPAYDADFALESGRIERLRLLALEELTLKRAEAGSASAISSVFGRRTLEDRARNRKKEPTVPKVATRKQKPEPEKVDVAQLGEARTAHLMANREEVS